MTLRAAAVIKSDMKMHNEASEAEIAIGDLYDTSFSYVIRSHADGNWSWEAVETRDQRDVLGFGVRIPATGRDRLVAYFSRSRIDREHAPDYRDSLCLFFDSEVFDLLSPSTTTRFRWGLLSRSFSVSKSTSGDPVVFEYDYAWPVFRELSSRLLGDPFAYTSRDFFFELKKLLSIYRS